MNSWRRGTDTVLLIFFVSGFCGLIYESVWAHYVKLFLGHAAYAQTLVLVVFIGGLALGSWLCARVAERIRNPLLGYAIVEAVDRHFRAGVPRRLRAARSTGATRALLPTACEQASTFCASAVGALGGASPAAVDPARHDVPAGELGGAAHGQRPTPATTSPRSTSSTASAPCWACWPRRFLLIPAVGLPGTLHDGRRRQHADRDRRLLHCPRACRRAWTCSAFPRRATRAARTRRCSCRCSRPRSSRGSRPSSTRSAGSAC